MPIKDTDKKLEDYTGAIISDAIEDSRQIVIELREKQEKIIKKADMDIAAEAMKYQNAKIAEIKTKESLKINARMIENKHTILQYREDCAIEAFKEVEAKIMEFTASEEYLPHLKSLLKRAVEVLGFGIVAVVYLRPEDLHFFDELQASVTGVNIAVREGEFYLGGMRVVCPTKGQRIDMSFDTAMIDMVGHFTEITGLNMGE